MSRLNLRKFVLFFVAIIATIWVSPDHLYSIARITTSVPAGSDHKVEQPPTNVPSQAPAAKKKAGGKQGEDHPPKTPQEKILEGFNPFDRPSLITQAAVLTILSLLPFIIMILTSFMKIVIVLSLLRNALGVQQAPPNQILNGVAVMLSLFIMYPTVVKMYDASKQSAYGLQVPDSLVSTGSSAYIIKMVTATQEPLKQFLINNSSVKHRAMFYRMSYKVLPDEYRPNLTPEDLIIVVPSYIVSQLKEAFEIGVLIYIPFFVIDLVTSNVLLAMGMMMLSPVTISMPLKLFLLVMLDGWSLLVEGLVNTFR